MAPATSTSPAEAPAPSPSAQAAGAVQHGLQVVCEGTDPIVDIVAVHGLNGDREKTWTAGNGVHWLRDLLPHDLPRARILSWGYDANTHSGSRVSCEYLFDHARTLVSDLCLERQITETSRRPIVFVAHSLGGIIVKSALIHSEAARRGALEEHRAVKLSTYGILFMGTPHQGGSGVALGKLMVNVASVFVKADDRLLQQQLGQYGPISGDFVTKYAYETYATPTLLGQSMVVVPQASAVVPGAADGEPMAIHADHIHMVKFESKSDAGYKTVSGHLRLMATRAGNMIGQQWDTEGRLNTVRSNEVVTSFAVQFISMLEVSPVERFVGRQEELDAVHKGLPYDGSRKTVLVHGLGGMGKTQLVLDKSEDTLKQGCAAAAERIYREHPSLLAEKLDGLPLALATAGAYLHQATTSFADHLPLYLDLWLLLQEATPHLLSYEDKALYLTWNISFDHAKQQSELAAKLLQLWALSTTTSHNLGDLYADQGKLGEAEEMYERALEGKEKALGPDHTSTLSTINNLGLLYADQGKLEEAQKMYERALKGYEKNFGTDYPQCHTLRRALIKLRGRAGS
ncbi:hypothetical protein SLS59_007081 [Nothophoma quercina]|uniref:DUF676 domain-containing protein n=1 Tax=Nothophoma quercina TaxID=749835 RepID=A0ABR3R0Y2_9PLEO